MFVGSVNTKTTDHLLVLTVARVCWAKQAVTSSFVWLFTPLQLWFALHPFARFLRALTRDTSPSSGHYLALRGAFPQLQQRLFTPAVLFQLYVKDQDNLQQQQPEEQKQLLRPSPAAQGRTGGELHLSPEDWLRCQRGLPPRQQHSGDEFDDPDGPQQSPSSGETRVDLDPLPGDDDDPAFLRERELWTREHRRLRLELWVLRQGFRLVFQVDEAELLRQRVVAAWNSNSISNWTLSSTNDDAEDHHVLLRPHPVATETHQCDDIEMKEVVVNHEEHTSSGVLPQEDIVGSICRKQSPPPPNSKGDVAAHHLVQPAWRAPPLINNLPSGAPSFSDFQELQRFRQAKRPVLRVLRPLFTELDRRHLLSSTLAFRLEHEGWGSPVECLRQRVFQNGCHLPLLLTLFLVGMIVVAVALDAGGHDNDGAGRLGIPELLPLLVSCHACELKRDARGCEVFCILLWVSGCVHSRVL